MSDSKMKDDFEELTKKYLYVIKQHLEDLKLDTSCPPAEAKVAIIASLVNVLCKIIAAFHLEDKYVNKLLVEMKEIIDFNRKDLGEYIFLRTLVKEMMKNEKK